METTEKWSLAIVTLVGAYIVLVPSISLIPGLELYNERRALEIGVLLLVGGSLLASSTARGQWVSTFRVLPSPAQWGLGFVVGLGILSSTLAPAPLSAFLELGHFVLLFVTAGVVASAVRQAPEWTERVLLGAVVMSALLYAVYFAVRYGGALTFPALEIGRETVGGFANTRFFNQYQTWTLPLLVGALSALPRGWRAARGTIFGLAALWWALVFASNVRGTVVALAIAGIGVWVLFRKPARRWVGIQVGALLIGGVLYYVLFTLGGGIAPQVVERMGEVGQSRRLQHWAKCLDMVWTHPWFGVGPMHYAWPPYDFAAAAHPHNAFMQWLAEWGIPSTAIMSGLTIWGGWRWLQQEKDDAKTADTRPNAVRVALVASIFAGTVHAMVSGIIVMPLSQMLFVLVGGWAWGRYRHSCQAPTATCSFRPQAVLCVVLVASIGIVGSSLHDLFAVQERRSAFLEAVDRNRLSPRYWTQGYLHVRDPEVINRARSNW